MATDTADFRASDLITSAGTGSNGEKLVNTLPHHYPPELQAALLKRINPKLDDRVQSDDALGKVAKIADVSRVEGAHVRGGFARNDEAVVTYAALDDADGTVHKGMFPLSDLGKGSSEKHISQRDSLANSPVGKAFIQETGGRRRKSAAQDEDESVSVQDPIDFLSGASVEQLQELMAKHPERADAIKDFEKATRGKGARKTVLEFDAEAAAKEEADGKDS
jgi:hypothetical protein